MKNLNLIIVLTALFVANIYSQTNAWKYLNFESGGYVMEIIPVKYPAGQQPGDINQQVLYARTDVGGIYRSSDNGQNWVYASNYVNYVGLNPGITLSETHIQGTAVRHNGPNWNSPQTVVVAWGNEEPDAESKQYRSIWRSTNSGVNWEQFPAIIQAPGVWFQGNNLPVKIGGPCITYDPNNVNGEDSWMYMGGFGPTNNNQCRLFKSIDDGRTWNRSGEPLLDNFPGQAGEGIISISIKPGNTQHIWVGTTHGLVFTTNAGVNWQRRNIGGVNDPHVKRILLQKDGSNNITGAMVTWGNWGSSGIGRLLANNNWNYEALNTQFFALGSNQSGMFSALTYIDDAESIILAGLYERPLRKTNDFGNSWVGETNNSPNNEVVFRYHPTNNNFPAHQQRGELDPDWGFMYDGLSCVTKNPNTGWGDRFYLSGGAGTRMTVIGPTNNNFADSRWKYTVLGQAMTVNYDVAFNTVNYNGYPNGRKAIYLPLSDWTMGWTYTDRLNPNGSNWLIPDTLSFDRQETRLPDPYYDTYISNVIRTLFNPGNPNISYCAGGSVYNLGVGENRLAGFYMRTINTDGVITAERQNTDLMLRESDRAIVDALLIPTGGNGRIIGLVGKNSGQSPPNLSYTGIYYSNDEGLNWTQGSFNVTGDAGRTTAAEYNNSKLPALGAGINGTISGLFGGHFTLASAGGGLVYLWLESNDVAPWGGGIFISTDDGASWRAGENPDNFDGYFGPGSLKYLGGNQIALAFRDFRGNPNGLYKGTIGNNGSLSWQAFGNFMSAEHLDVQNSTWAVYGKRAGDVFNQVYASTNNGANWEKIPKNNEALPYFPKVHSLKIRPEPNNNELWISTSGQGVWIYDQLTSSCTQSPWIITENTTINQSMNNAPNIIVTNGARLTIEGTSGNPLTFDMCPDAKIEVQEGSSISVSYVNFGSSLGNWQGIKLVNATASSIRNSNFSKSLTPISIEHSNISYSVYLKSISANTFNIPSTMPSSAVTLSDVHNCIIEGNAFNLTENLNAVGIDLVNIQSGSVPGILQAVPRLSIISNSFTGGAIHMSLNCEFAGLTEFYIQRNTLNGTSNSAGTGIFARKISGSFNRNTFTNEQYSNSILLLECYLNMFGNIIKSKENHNIDLQLNTTAILEPLINESGQYIWYGGYNDMTMLNRAGTINYSNVNFTEGCTMLCNRGENCFNLSVLQNNYHIIGRFQEPCPLSFEVKRNMFNGYPSFDITCSGNPVFVSYDPVLSYCYYSHELNPITIGYEITDMGNGIYDTVIISTPPVGGGQAFSGNQDRILFGNILSKIRTRNYVSSINDAKILINQFDSSKYWLAGLDLLYKGYKMSDTSNNQSQTNILFGELKFYLDQKINHYSSNSEFVNKAYGYYLRCLGRMRNFTESIAGYENIMNNHPNSLVRLSASWDRAAAILLMNTGGGGFNAEIYAEKLKEILSNEPVHQIAKDVFITEKTFSDERKEDDGNKDNREDINSIRDSELSKRVVFFNPSNRTELNRKISEDVKAILGITNINKKDNGIVPLKFTLYQNYPNPFNPVTTIKYDLPRDAKVTVKIYDLLGREVAVLVNNDIKKAGTYNVEWYAGNFASGVYFYKIEAGDFVQSKKMVLVK